MLGAAAAGLVLGGSVFLLVIGFWPEGNQSRILSFPGETTSPGQVGPLPLLSSARTLTLEWSPVVRLQDSGKIRLSFAPASDDEALAGAGPGGGGVGPKGNPSFGEVPSVPILVEARLDMAGVEADPLGMTSMPMASDQASSFTWTIRSPEEGKYRGVVWLYLRSIPLSGVAGSERALAALPVDIQVVSVLGLGVGPLRILGAAGTLVGLILGLLSLEMPLQRFSPRSRALFTRHDENNIK